MKGFVLFFVIVVITGLFATKAHAVQESLVWETPSLMWGEDHRVYQLDQDPEPEIMYVREDGVFCYDVEEGVLLFGFSDPGFSGLADHPRDYDGDSHIEFFYYTDPTEWNGQSVHLYSIYDQTTVWEWVAEPGERYEIVVQTPGEAPLELNSIPLVYIRYYSDASTIGWERIYHFDGKVASVNTSPARTLPSLEVSPSPLTGSGSASINFSLPSTSVCKLSLYDASGRLVETLLDDRREAGQYSTSLNVRDAGVYFVRLRTDEGMTASRKLVVVR